MLYVWHQKYENKKEGVQSNLTYSFNRILKISLSLRYRSPDPVFGQNRILIPEYNYIFRSEAPLWTRLSFIHYHSHSVREKFITFKRKGSLGFTSSFSPLLLSFSVILFSLLTHLLFLCFSICVPLYPSPIYRLLDLFRFFYIDHLVVGGGAVMTAGENIGKLRCRGKNGERKKGWNTAKSPKMPPFG